MEIGEQIQWVVIEVSTVDGKPAVFVEPGTLSLEHGWVGTIVWYAFTENYILTDIKFLPQFDPDGPLPPFDGAPLPDPDRPNCISAVTANTAKGTFPYTVTVLNQLTGETLTGDPVVENEPPPTHGMMPEELPQPFSFAATA